MSRHNFGRYPSVVFTSDDDDDDNNNSNNRNQADLLDVQVFTPMSQLPSEPRHQAPLQHTTTTTTTTTVGTTNELQRSPMLISTTSPRQRASKRRAASATPIRRTNKDIEIIDLVTPPKMESIASRFNYTIRRLTLYNQIRRSILPTFPTMAYTHEPNLLLANVSIKLLSTEELVRRQPGLYPCPFQIINSNPTTSSFMINCYNTYFNSILSRFKMDLSILDHNYDRLNYFIELFCASRRRLLGTIKCAEDLVDLSDDEKPQLLEFYLQMDVDLFYMKTCSYSDARPRSFNEGIFCLDPPQCLYAMSKCGHCDLCTSFHHTDHDHVCQQQSPVLFDNYNRHRFVNGYESILNCPVNCNTKNFIYVLTCLCGNFDYICETKFTLSQRLKDHRTFANRLIRKLLIGKENLKNNQLTHHYASSSSLSAAAPLPTPASNSNKEKMLLYQHLMQCSTVIQLFLDKNPSYWPFLPMTIAEANQDNTIYQQMRARKTTPANMFQFCQGVSTRNFLNNIPRPPAGYKFSNRQVEKQIKFFQMNKIDELFDDQVNIYHAGTIAVVLPSTFDLFHHIVHSLFVTHTEAKLNILGHVFDHPSNHSVRHGLWCSNLVRTSNFLS